MVNVKKHVNNSLVPFSKIQCLEIVAACLFTFSKIIVLNQHKNKLEGLQMCQKLKKKKMTTLNKTLKKQVT